MMAGLTERKFSVVMLIKPKLTPTVPNTIFVFIANTPQLPQVRNFYCTTKKREYIDVIVVSKYILNKYLVPAFLHRGLDRVYEFGWLYFWKGSTMQVSKWSFECNNSDSDNYLSNFVDYTLSRTCGYRLRGLFLYYAIVAAFFHAFRRLLIRPQEQIDYMLHQC